ncbi:MAG: VacJ family lipoprotein [Campylobacteraceae bacterium]|jgi:phospholipid-binding lipoprotein MlaA|nr:VacJ family lipoprotein [Campylobacteraceae bacterium]
MRLLFFIILLLFIGGCADKSVSPQVAFDSQEIDEFEEEFLTSSSNNFDPLEGYNRVMTKFNDVAITHIIFPVAKGYKKIVPQGARNSIGNFFDNLMFPIRFANNIFQGKIANAFSESGRFIINTTVGFLGFADVATDIYKIEEHREDFGQTLGYWGIPGGPHIVLPFLGPSNIRDFSGGFVDMVANPINYFEWRQVNLLNNGDEAFVLKSADILNSMPQITDMYDMATKDAIDLYPLLKNMYEQRRNALIKE